MIWVRYRLVLPRGDASVVTQWIDICTMHIQYYHLSLFVRVSYLGLIWSGGDDILADSCWNLYVLRQSLCQLARSLHGRGQCQLRVNATALQHGVILYEVLWQPLHRE